MKAERWQQVERLFHAALEREPAARSAFLADECAGDEELRGEVESLLAYEDRAAGLTAAVLGVARELADERLPALATGQTVAHYRVLGPLGAGGMGEVFLAEDTRLGRSVALKLLPAHLTREGSLRRRFEQEARAVAALSHPNVCTLHEVVQTDEGRHCLVMEYVEGVTLRQRLAAGPLAVAEALEVAVQLAAALAAAHAAGVVHRDVKPENVIVRGDGYVKVLDFGLAKVSERPTDDGRSPSSLETAIATRPGVLMGTVGYVSPEQARGLSVDAQTDVWSLGVVLYEMVAGRRPFQGETPMDVALAIIERPPPPLAEAAPGAPAELERILTRTLAKERERRYPTVAELLADLKDLRRQLDVDSAAGTTLRARAVGGGGGSWRRRRRSLAAAAGLSLAVGAGIYFVADAREGSPPARGPLMTRMSRLTELAGIEEFPALSPDRKSVAFTAYEGDRRQLFVGLVAGGVPLQLTRDAADHQQPRWLPDSSSLLYYSAPDGGGAQGTVWEVPALGGPPRRILRSLGGADARLADARLACFRLNGQRVELVSAARDGSGVEVVAGFAPSSYYLYPRWSPDGRWIAFQRGDGLRFDLFAVPAAGGEPRRLTDESSPMSGFSWLSDSTGVVLSSSRASTVPYLPTFSLWEARLAGGALRQVTSGESSYLQPDVQGNGAIVATRMRIELDLWQLPVDGQPRDNVQRARRLTRQTGYVQTPSAAPGDREVAFLSDKGGHTNIWALRPETGEMRQLTYERDPAVSVGLPLWSPAGGAIAYVSTRGNAGLGFGLWRVDADGSNPRRLVRHGLGPAWSADGRWLYYVPRAQAGIEKVAAGGGAPVRVRAEAARNVSGAHGSTLYFTVERPLVDGQPQFEVRAATPEGGPSRLLATIPAARVPSWQVVNPALSADGRWLALALTEGFTTDIWALSTTTGEWRQLTDFGGRTTLIARRVSWSSDGRSVFAAVGEGDADIVLLETAVAPRR